MKTKITTILLLAVLSLCQLRAQSLPDIKYAVLEELDVTDSDALTTLISQWKAFVSEKFPDYPDWLYFTDDEKRAYFLNFIEDYSAVHRNEEKFMKAVSDYQQSGRRPSLMPLWLRSNRSTTRQFARFRPELSYVNEERDVTSLAFRKVVSVYLLRDQEEAWRQALGKLNALDKQMGIETSRYVFEVTVGSELPLYWVVIPAESVSDYYSELEARMAERARHSLGTQWLEVYENMRDTSSRKVDQRNLTLHPELSLMRGMD